MNWYRRFYGVQMVMATVGLLLFWGIGHLFFWLGH